MNSSVFVVVPAFNERNVILSTLQPLIKLNYTVVVVDDGSSDGTWSVLTNLPVYALRHAVNLGQGAALQTGMMFALQWANLLAHSLGVGRGADLMNYLGWIGIAFVCIGLYSKLRVLESHLTELTRVQAIEHAHAPGKGDEAMGSEGGGARDY